LFVEGAIVTRFLPGKEVFLFDLTYIYAKHIVVTSQGFRKPFFK